MSPDEIKDFDDPLMSRVKRREERRNKKASGEHGSFSWATLLAGLALLAALGALAYYLVTAQQRIEELNANLVSSQEKLVQVTEKLGESQDQIKTLEGGLQKSQELIGQQRQELGRTRSAVTNLQSSQDAHEKELQTLSIKKADQDQVEKLAEKADGIEAKVGDVDSRLSQANSNIGELRDMSTRNRTDIEGNKTAIGEVRKVADDNTDNINGVKHSLERDYYNFELQKNSGVMKVFDVALSLKDTNYKNQKFTIEIVANGKRIKKKGQSINEPIFFYAGDNNKRYELLVNRIEKGMIVGYVSVPKS